MIFMKVTFDNVYNAFQIIAPKGTMISFTGEPTALADGVYLVGDDGIINLDEQFLTDTLYLSTEGTDYTVTGGMRVTYPLGDETVIIRAGSSTIPFSKGGKGGGGSGGGCNYKGTTTTPISNGSTTNPITIDGEDYTAVFGDIAVYNYTEFVFDGTQWSEFGRPFDTTPTRGSVNAVTSDGIYKRTPWARGGGAGSASAVGGNGACIASGDYSAAFGSNAEATGKNSLSFGYYSKASNMYTVATGYNTQASQLYMVAIGRENKPRYGDLFNIGNGYNSRSNIVEVNSTSANVNGNLQMHGVNLPVPYTTMPTITAAMLGQIAMYVGETTNDYVKGYFYIASSDGAAEPTYYWQPVDKPAYTLTTLWEYDGVEHIDTVGTVICSEAELAKYDFVGLLYGFRDIAGGKVTGQYNFAPTMAMPGTLASYASFATTSNTIYSGRISISNGNLKISSVANNTVTDQGITYRMGIYRVIAVKFGVSDAALAQSDDYTTTERKIGKWIDGSDLYQRTFEVTASSVNGWNDNVLGTSGIKIVDVQGFMYGLYEEDVYVSKPLVYFRTTTDYITVIYDDDVNVYIMDGAVSTSPMPTLTITIKYTKPSAQANLMQMPAPTEEVSETPTAEEDDMR
jgi:hypothetical protein